MKQFMHAHKRAILLSLSAVLIVLTAIGGTLAWLTSKPSGLVNTFEPGKVPITVHETFTQGGTTKTNVYIQNDGNIPAYIRVALVPIWRDAEGYGTGLATDGTFTWELNLTEDGWKEGGDGYYYYQQSVPPDDLNDITPALVETCSPKQGLDEAYKGKYFELQVLAQSIQADGMNAAGAVDAFDKALKATATDPLPTT